MEPSANDPIHDYIRANRDRYTKEAIRDQLLAAGHEQAAIDEAWQQIVAEATPARPEGSNLSLYVWILYWLGAGIIAAFIVIGFVGGGGFVSFFVGWLVAYLVLTYLPARAMARARPTGTGGVLAVIVGVPLLVLLIGGGICFGTIAIFAAGLGG